MNRPIIGITTNLGAKGAELARGYWQSIRRAGGVPMLLAPTGDTEEQEAQLEQLDGLLLSGGGDINPVVLGEDPVPELHSICPERDAYELRLCRRAHDRQIPVMGICRGAQVMAVALGGRVAQDIERCQRENGQTPTVKHSQDAPRECATHFVECTQKDGLWQTELVDLLGPRFAVNSFHHQAVTDPGPHMTVAARSADGVIEALEERDGESYLRAYQWHPECMTEMAPLFDDFVEEARDYCAALELHARIQTLDSHCDTPMFFDQLQADFDQQTSHPLGASPFALQQRNDTVLVDAEKMNDGHLDETFMVAYIPQGPRTPEGYADARRQVEETYRRMDEMIAATPDFAAASPATATATPTAVTPPSTAVTPPPAAAAPPLDSQRPVPANQGLCSATGCGITIHRGIENGYAIGRDLSLIEHYKRLGCEYITLCHNGHNDICDSARPLKAGVRADGTYPAADEPLAEHGGLSPFGREVVEEMNRVGMLIDLSHAGEKTVYDVLEASTKPVAVTHACCRAICDHPRNLTDDQLRAIAAKGGVVQCTMYHGFLTLPPADETAAAAGQPAGNFGAAPVSSGADVPYTPPTLYTFMRHLEHMIEVCGVDHVGIGSDFDGDGGVPGLDHAGCMINITRELLRRGYSDDDICKIWGDNFRRVLAAQ